jgi:hypothetical protein
VPHQTIFSQLFVDAEAKNANYGQMVRRMVQSAKRMSRLRFDTPAASVRYIYIYVDM